MMLFGAGCWGDAPVVQTPPIEQPITQPPVTPPLTPPEQPASSTSQAPVPKPFWKMYTSEIYQFAFQYPQTGKMLPVKSSLLLLDSPSDIVELDLGDTAKPFYNDQNVPDLKLSVEFFPKQNSNLKGCYYSSHGWDGDQGQKADVQKKVRIGSQEFCMTSESDAAAGNRYYTYSYSIPKGSDYLVFIFTVHSVNCQNYSDPVKQCMEFDEARDTALIPEILKTYHEI